VAAAGDAGVEFEDVGFNAKVVSGMKGEKSEVVGM
jgi:hypothetical protein